MVSSVYTLLSMSHLSQRIVAIVAAFLIVAQLPAQDKAGSNDTPLGQQTFSVCTGCHGLDGAGGEHAPNIATDPNVQRMTDSALLAIIKNGIPAAGMPGFSKVLNDQQIRAVLTYLRTLQGNRSNANVPGNAKNGREVFFGRGGCAECHMINGRGGFLAADLSDYGKAHSPASIREAIVSPNQESRSASRNRDGCHKGGQNLPWRPSQPGQFLASDANG